MKKSGFVILVASLLVCPTKGMCMDWSLIQYNARGGLILPDNDADLGIVLGGQALLPIEKGIKLSLGGSLDYSLAGGDADFSGIEIMGIGRYDFDLKNGIRAFGQAGVGVLFWKMEYENEQVQLETDGTDLGLSIGGGLKFGENVEAMALIKLFDAANSIALTIGYNF